jgi:hypothetical protein
MHGQRLPWLALDATRNPSRRPHDHDVESVRRERVRAIAVKLIQVGNADQ